MQDEDDSSGTSDASEEDRAEAYEQEPVRSAGELREAYAYYSGWKAKSRAAQKRKQRGFKPASASAPRRSASEPSDGSPRKDSRPGSRASRSPKKGSIPKPPASTDARKKTSRCADCGQLGRWKGDAECPVESA